MDQSSLQNSLSSLPLAQLRYFDSIGSTNDEALAWAMEDAPDFSLIAADEQTSGRGRAGHKWATPPGAALAFSLILRPTETEAASPSLFTGLGAVALVEVLQAHGLTAQIKWPNDVLLNRKKCAGILVESVWTGEALDALVLGMGVNVRRAAIPPARDLFFPATSLENELGHAPEREELLAEILAAVLKWRPRLGKDDLLRAWQDSLAFMNEQVQVQAEGETPLEGRITGLDADGGLRLRLKRDKIVTVHFGEMHLRPTV